MREQRDRRPPRRTGGAAAAAVALLAVLIAGAQALADAGQTELVSRASGLNGPQANSDSTSGSITPDGRFVVFSSRATNLSPDDGDIRDDIYVRDLDQGTTTLVSRASGANGAKANRDSFGGSISADGRFVAFITEAANLDPDDGDELYDVYVRDLEQQTTTLVSRAAGADGEPADRHAGGMISADGRSLLLSSMAGNLHPDATDGQSNVYVRNLESHTITLVSRASGANGAPGDGDSFGSSISADGRFAAFGSSASNLDHDDEDSIRDVYVRDVVEQTTTLVSRASGADGAKANHDSFGGSISADGRRVAFASTASNLNPATIAGDRYVYVRDLDEDETILASRGSGANGDPAPDSWSHSISPDGRFVVFDSDAIRLRGDLPRGDALSHGGSISAGGRFVAFTSIATNLHPDAAEPGVRVFRRELDLEAPVEPTPPLADTREAAWLTIDHARVRNRRLVVRGSVLRRAERDERITVRFRARGRGLRLRPRLRSAGGFTVKRTLRGRLRHARAGKLIVRHTGNDELLPAVWRLRAARHPVGLRFDRAPEMRGRNLLIAGRVVPDARKQVIVWVQYTGTDGSPVEIVRKVRVDPRGRFRGRIRLPNPNAVRNRGATVSLAHRGRGRLHGEVIADLVEINQRRDVYVRDLETNTTQMVSRAFGR